MAGSRPVIRCPPALKDTPTKQALVQILASQFRLVRARMELEDGHCNPQNISLASRCSIGLHLRSDRRRVPDPVPARLKGFGHPFALFLSCVFMVALMFGRPSGFFAVALSALLSTAFFAPVSSIHLMRAFEYFQIEIYVALAVGATIMADQIHRVLISLADINIQLASEDGKKMLQLREVAHRVANNFACLDALIRQRAMASKDPKI